VAEAFPRRTLIALAFAPAWANRASAGFCPPQGDCLFPPARSSLPAWERFVARAARTFPRSDLEIWNEPNMSYFWQPAVDPEGYARLAKAAWRAVRRERAAGRSRARVAVGALAEALDSDTSRTQWGFLDQLFGQGLRGHYDAISWHAYPYQHDGSVEDLSGGVFAEAWQEMRDVVKRHDPNARFWITETGVTTTGPDAVSPGEQGQELGAITRKLLDMHDVDAVYVHTLFDPAVQPEGDRERGFGVIEAPSPGRRRVKPAFCALARVGGGSDGAVGRGRGCSGGR
jgi:hypothetical protein